MDNINIKGKRIFIENLPEAATESDIQNKFSKYGKITLIDIKERKLLTHKNLSRFYAYVNLETDESRLQKCFQEFKSTAWYGQNLKLQMARESFLEKLKRERESNVNRTNIENNNDTKRTTFGLDVQEEVNSKGINNEEPIMDSSLLNGTKVQKRKASQLISVDTSILKKNKKQDYPQGETVTNAKMLNESKGHNRKASHSLVSDISISDKEASEEESILIAGLDFSHVGQEDVDEPKVIIKNNADKLINGSLVIKGVGKEPILKIVDKRNKPRSLDKFRSQANHKRIDSLLEKRKAYSQQKTAIQAALSYSNLKKPNKIVFTESDGSKSMDQIEAINNKSDKSKQLLFEEGDSDPEENDQMFEIKEKFQGKAGAKLLKLQSTFKNDKRFKLNENFLEDFEGKQEIEQIVDIEEEKKKEFEILEGILGHGIKSNLWVPNECHDRNENEVKTMRRFDPTQPDHEKYEIRNKYEKIHKNQKASVLIDKKIEEKDEPEVSKEVFYTVGDDLKKSLETDKGFSLLSMFGETEQKEEAFAEGTMQPIKKNKYPMSDNPFKYDSSEDEDDQILMPEQKECVKPPTSIKAWTEPFFFQEDDFRFQEGMDFVQRIAAEEQDNFLQIRKNLKEIARNKVRKVLAKNKPFRKKLGGSKRKKAKRMQKALKR